MILPPARIVSLISQDMTLDPGDVIACGTSLGVLPMRSGTIVEVVIDGIGSLRNRYEALASQDKARNEDLRSRRRCDRRVAGGEAAAIGHEVS